MLRGPGTIFRNLRTDETQADRTLQQIVTAILVGASKTFLLLSP